MKKIRKLVCICKKIQPYYLGQTIDCPVHGKMRAARFA